MLISYMNMSKVHEAGLSDALFISY